jgi:phosphoenolpyruvate-protein kinase (PTS system EI component)
MANNLIALVDGETVILEGEALDELLAAQESATAKLEAEKAEAQTRATAKAALLDRLGITQDEAKLLLA